MDFDLRQWLLILGPLFIAGVLVHGYFRMRAGHNNIKMKLDRDFVSKPGEAVAEEDELKMLRAELPNGGARVKKLAPEIDGDVPVLMESVELPSVSAKDEPREVREPHQQTLSALDDTHTSVSEGRPKEDVKPSPTPKAPPAAPEKPAVMAETQEEPGVAAGQAAPPAQKPADKPAAPAKPEKFVVMHVLALDQPFAGQGLVELLVNAGMRHGEMEIFHREDAAGEPLFSLASAVEPGTFDMSAMDTFSTPGVTLFMRVHELDQPLAVLEDMLGVAETIAGELGGEVRDETRSVMTPQTIEHCRQSIREFQFKHSA